MNLWANRLELIWLRRCWWGRQCGWHLAAASAVVSLRRRHHTPSSPPSCSGTCPPTGGVTDRPSICSVGGRSKALQQRASSRFASSGSCCFSFELRQPHLRRIFLLVWALLFFFYFCLILFRIILSMTAFYLFFTFSGFGAGFRCHVFILLLIIIILYYYGSKCKWSII